MKFCPVCASILNEELECESCGFKTTDDDIEKRRDKSKIEGNIFYFTEPNFAAFNNKRQPVEKKDSATLEELINTKKTDEKIEALTYSGGGGMQGGHFSTRLSFKDKELTTTNKQFHYTPTTVAKYSVSDEKLNEIREYIEKYNFPAWSEIREDESLRPTDISVTVLSLCYPSYSYSISFITNFNKEESDIFFKLRDLVFECANEDNLIDKKELNDGKDIMGLGMMNVPDNMNTNPSTSKEQNNNISYDGVCPCCNYKIDRQLKFCPECGSKIIQDEV